MKHTKKVMILGIMMGAMMLLVACSGGEDENNEVGLAQTTNTTDLDDDLVDGEYEDDEEVDEEVRRQAIAEEEALMANVPVFDLSTDEVARIIEVLEASSFEFRVVEPTPYQTNEVVITLETGDPLANLSLMAEFEQVATQVLEIFGIGTYPRELIEGMITTVTSTDVVADWYHYTDVIALQIYIWNNQTSFIIHMH